MGIGHRASPPLPYVRHRVLERALWRGPQIRVLNRIRAHVGGEESDADGSVHCRTTLKATVGRYCERTRLRQERPFADFGAFGEWRVSLAPTLGYPCPSQDAHISISRAMSISTGSFARSCPAAGAGDFEARAGLLACPHWFRAPCRARCVSRSQAPHRIRRAGGPACARGRHRRTKTRSPRERSSWHPAPPSPGRWLAALRRRCL